MLPVNWTPLYDKVIVKRDAAKEEFAPGLAVPDSHKQDQNTGTVQMVGQGRWIQGVLYPLTVAVGDSVLFSKFAGVELEGQERDLIILREDEILAWKSAGE